MRCRKKLLGLGLIICLLVMPIQAKTLTGFTYSGTTLVPLRTISEELGATVDMDTSTKEITLTYKEQEVILMPNETSATVNGVYSILPVAPMVVDGTTYVPLRFLAESLGGIMTYNEGVITFELDETVKEWTLEATAMPMPSTSPFKTETKTVNGKSVNMVTIDVKDPRVTVDIALAHGAINSAQSLAEMNTGANSYASINGTYFAAYNGDMPLPHGTVVKGCQPLHITDVGATVGFTSSGTAVIDFVKTRVQGYINGEASFISYRINRPTPDTSATVLFTPEYTGEIPLEAGWTAIVCEDNVVTKKVTSAPVVPANGFVLTTPTNRSERFNIGDEVTYEVTFEPQNTSQQIWDNVVHAISAGPSLMINGEITGDPKDESFTEEKILTQSAQRSFIGVMPSGEVVIGTTVATVNEMKAITKAMGLYSAMCLDGGASSGLYANTQALTTPGRLINNSIQFKFNQ